MHFSNLYQNKKAVHACSSAFPSSWFCQLDRWICGFPRRSGCVNKGKGESRKLSRSVAIRVMAGQRWNLSHFKVLRVLYSVTEQLKATDVWHPPRNWRGSTSVCISSAILTLGPILYCVQTVLLLLSLFLYNAQLLGESQHRKHGRGKYWRFPGGQACKVLGENNSLHRYHFKISSRSYFNADN